MCNFNITLLNLNLNSILNLGFKMNIYSNINQFKYQFINMFGKIDLRIYFNLNPKTQIEPQFIVTKV